MTLEIEQAWIPVDTLPEEGCFVLVACISAKGNYKRIPVTAYHYWDGIFSTVNWYTSNHADGITHWMPLPKSVKRAGL